MLPHRDEGLWRHQLDFFMFKDLSSALTISSHQMRIQVQDVGYIYLRCWPKCSHRNPQTIQAIFKTIGCSPQTDDKDPMLGREFAHELVYERLSCLIIVETPGHLGWHHSLGKGFKTV